MESLPASLESEKAVLSCMMQAPEHTLAVAANLLTPKDFHFPPCELLFTTLRGMYGREEPIDPVSIVVGLNTAGILEKIGGPGFVSECYTASPNPGHLKHYAGQVIECSRRRQMWRIGEEISRLAIHDDEKWRDSISPLIRKAEVAMEDAKESTMRCLKDVAYDYTEQYGHGGENGADPPTNTGCSGLDKLLTGGVRKEYVLIGGKQGHGKTLLGAQLGGKLAQNGKAGLWVGWEMTDVQVFMRDVARESGVPLNVVMGRESPENQAQFQKITRTISMMLEKWRLHFIDDPYITLESVAAHARQLKRDGKLDYMALDFLQLAPVKRERGERRDEVLCDVSNFAERLRKELDITLIAMVQLNDDGLIRDSRSILDSPQVFIRIEMDTAPEDADEEVVLDTGKFRVLKNRFGQCDRACPVVRNGALQMFQDGEFRKQPPVGQTFKRKKFP